MVVGVRGKVGVTRQAKLEDKLKVCNSIVQRYVEFGFAGLAGPYLHYFPNTAEEEGFLSLAEGYGRRNVVHGRSSWKKD